MSIGLREARSHELQNNHLLALLAHATEQEKSIIFRYSNPERGRYLKISIPPALSNVFAHKAPFGFLLQVIVARTAFNRGATG